MSDYYVSPVSSGTGSSIADAMSVSALQPILKGLKAADHVYFIADQGDYNVTTGFNLRAAGTAGQPITMSGISSTGAQMAATFAGTRSAVYANDADHGTDVFRITAGASHYQFSNLDFKNIDDAFRIGGAVSDIAITKSNATNIGRFVDNNIIYGNTSATISGLKVSDVNVAGFAKGVIWLDYDTHDVVMDNVNGDSKFIDGANFAMGVHLDGTVHDVIISNTQMGNIVDTLHRYWNGDGFTTEEGVYNVTFINTRSYNNTDAGYDLKSTNTKLIGATADGNTRNFRFWTDVVADHISGSNPVYHGGISTYPVNVWVKGGAHVSISDSTFTGGTGNGALFDLSDGAGTISLADVHSSLQLADQVRLGKLGSISGLVLAMATSPDGPTSAPPSTSSSTTMQDHSSASGDRVPSGDGGSPATPSTPITPADMTPPTIVAPPPLALSAISSDLLKATPVGTTGADHVVADKLALAFSAGLGDDWLEGGVKGDTLHGDAGNDYILGGGLGDKLYGDVGDDVIVGDAASLGLAKAGQDQLWGGAGNDKLVGDALVLDGQSGARDFLHGEDGNDIVVGDAVTMKNGAIGGGDTLSGDAGDDWLFGDGIVTGSNVVGGADRLDGGAGNDQLYGGGGNDTFAFVRSGFGHDVIHDFSRVAGDMDTIELKGLKVQFSDLVSTQQGHDTLISLPSHDTILLVNVVAASVSADWFTFPG